MLGLVNAAANSRGATNKRGSRFIQSLPSGADSFQMSPTGSFQHGHVMYIERILMFKRFLWCARLGNSDWHPDGAFNPVSGGKSAAVRMMFCALLRANQEHVCPPPPYATITFYFIFSDMFTKHISSLATKGPRKFISSRLILLSFDPRQ